ncbi:MAG: UDP-N-acetylmuramoyl-tripeptide--D-alanyl-D-alanine ligase [Negativicutes bacterium]
MTACFTTDEVLTATKGQRIASGSIEVFTGISTDTRSLTPGALFVALAGDRFDGHDFLPAALRLGAAGFVVSRVPEAPLPGAEIFLVEDTRTAYQDLARFHRRRFGLPVIAVTGSNGKTSTKDMIAAILSTQLHVLKTEANFNNEIGLSQTLLRIDETHQAVVVEMGMRGQGEIAGLAAVALPTIGVVTNVGETHLERLGSIDNIASAKAELIEALDENGAAILNGDDPYVRAMAKKTAAPTRYYGLNQEADIRATHIIQTAQTVDFDCTAGTESFKVSVPIPGIHNVYNALAAIAVGLELGLTPESVSQGLSCYEPGKMRLNIKQMNGVTVIDDTYNASPLSMAAAIEVLSSVAKGRKLAAIGDMLELGPAASAAHAKVGDHLAAIGVEVVFTIGELAGIAGAAALKQGVPAAIVCSTHEEAVRELRRRLLPGDTLLLKGSRGMTMEKLLNVFATPSED